MNIMLLKIASFFDWLGSFLKENFFSSFTMDSYDKCIIVYDDTQPKDDKEEWGTLHFMGEECRFISGRWGRGYAPRGHYRGYKIIQYIKKNCSEYKSMGLFDLAFQLPLQFVKIADDATPHEKKRSKGMTGIAIHPDGNIEGTLGCFGLHPKNLDHLVRILNVFKNYLENNNYVNVEVL